MNVSHTAKLVNFLGSKVKSGRYNSASEVVREALRPLEEHEKARNIQLSEFTLELRRRLAQFDRGENVYPAKTRSLIQLQSQERRKSRA